MSSRLDANKAYIALPVSDGMRSDRKSGMLRSAVLAQGWCDKQVLPRASDWPKPADAKPSGLYDELESAVLVIVGILEETCDVGNARKMRCPKAYFYITKTSVDPARTSSTRNTKIVPTTISIQRILQRAHKHFFAMLKQALLLSFLYFFLIFLSGLIIDSVRVPYLQPMLGERYAEILELPIILFLTWHAAQITVWNLEVEGDAKSSRRWWSTAPLTIGVLALVWLITVEVGIVAVLYDNWVWNALKMYISEKDSVAGSASGLALLAYTTMPWVVWMVHGQDGEDETKLILDFDAARTEDEDYCTR